MRHLPTKVWKTYLMSTKSYTFSHAIVRYPSHSILDGLRAIDTGAPDFDIFNLHHKLYVEALVSTGASITALPPDEAFPDSVFVEDTALCLPEGAIITRPGAATRRGETRQIAPALTQLYEEILHIKGPGFIEGGDILTTEREILVGLSARTDAVGVSELQSLVARWGYAVRVVNTPPDILHFKTDCSLLDEETILTTPRLAATGCFEGYRLVHTAEGEDACANTIRFNELLIVPEGFPETTERLLSHGYTVKQVGNSEAAKLDGGMSCMSLRFTPS